MISGIIPNDTRSLRAHAAMWSVLLALLLGGCGREDGRRFAPLSPEAVVLVIGDSLVAGTGAPRGSAWPDELALRTGWSVINAGIPGNTSANARQRLAALLDEHRPDAVIIAVGGNDFLRKMRADETRANLDAMIREGRTATTHVAIVAVPAMSLGGALVGRLSDHTMFGDLAKEHALALVPSAVSEVLSREDLRSDRIHANADGYALLGARVADALAGYGWVRD